jgi:antitoxin component of RelBE/YafQ-DinJ toxin-antitoxin module
MLAIKIFLKKIINKKKFFCEIRDVNGFTLNNAETLRKSIEEAKNSKEVFNNEEELVNFLLKVRYFS